MKYDHKQVEKKWQDIWDEKQCFKAENGSDKEKFYALVEFPYPSGQGLHVGHPRSYTALDIVARKKRMQGYKWLDVKEYLICRLTGEFVMTQETRVGDGARVLVDERQRLLQVGIGRDVVGDVQDDCQQHHHNRKSVV